MSDEFGNLHSPRDLCKESRKGTCSHHEMMCGVGEVWGILILRWAWFYECFFKIHPLHADSMVLRFDYKAGTRYYD